VAVDCNALRLNLASHFCQIFASIFCQQLKDKEIARTKCVESKNSG